MGKLSQGKCNTFVLQRAKAGPQRANAARVAVAKVATHLKVAFSRRGRREAVGLDNRVNHQPAIEALELKNRGTLRN
jgi:hypothetical protein